MKKIIILTILLYLSFLNVSAASYTIVNKEILNYEINNFYIEDDYIVIDGWAIIDGDVQHFIDSSTHSYSLYIENIYDSSDNYIYDGSLLSADKTDMYKYTTTTKVCSLKSTYNDAFNCYTRYENVGFKFSIPLDDLKDDSEYQIYLRIDGKTAEVYYEIAIYAPNLSDSCESGGVLYTLNSDLSTIDLTVITSNLFVRSGPDISLNEVYGSYNACSYGKRLYWGEYITFSTLQEVYQSGSDYDSDTWFRLLYNEGLCQSSRSRAIMGYSYSGWIASVHTDFSGTPATIKTEILESVNMNDIITYTAKSGADALLQLFFESEISQTINIKVYYLESLVFDKDYKVSGSESIDIEFELSTYGEVDIVLTEENGVTYNYETEVYTSSEKTYYVNENETTISPDTPIMVVKNGNLVNYIYEEIDASIPYNYIKLSAGSSLYAWALINYSSGNNNIYLNSDVTSYIAFESAEESLDIELSSSGYYYVSLEKTDYNNYQALFNVSNMYLSNPDGLVYFSSSGLTNYVNGGRKWYTPINDELGSYDYDIYLKNIGVNGINIVFDCYYETVNTIFGESSSEYVIIRVENPTVIDYFLYKSYDSIDLSFYKERLNL